MRHALVTDGEQRAALATVRSLGRAGWQVVVTSRTGRSLAGASRHAAQDVAVPDPLTDPDGHRAAVAAVVLREGVRVVVPVTEPASLTLLADPAAPTTKVAGAVRAVWRMRIYSADADVASLLKRPDLTPDERARLYKLLAAFATPASITALLDAAQTDEAAALAARHDLA